MLSNLKKLALFAGLLTAIQPLTAFAADEVNLYSARKEALIKPLLDQFTEDTGIQVNLETGKADALHKRLQSEGQNSPADMLITTDAGRLHRAKAAGVTRSVSSPVLDAAVPENYRDPQGHWFGLSVRARPILYVRDKVDPARLSTYEDLADPRWKGEICIRSSSNIYNQSLVASMIAADGEEDTESWANGLVANFAQPPKGGDRDQIKAAAAGICDIAVANTYYLAGMLSGKDPAQKAAAEKMAVFWPNQDGRGVHVNVSGAAITAASKNTKNALQLLEYLVSADAQQWYAETNGEYPVLDSVPSGDILESWGTFKRDALNLATLGELNADALKLMDRAGWK